MDNQERRKDESDAVARTRCAHPLLEQEALSYALSLLVDDGRDIPTALYLTYMRFRERSLTERRLMDSPPGVEGWDEALAAARTLERAVNQAWTQALLAAFPPAPNKTQVFGAPQHGGQSCNGES